MCNAASQISNSYHSLHHICLVVPQCFDSVENIHNILLLDHLIDAADGTERSGTASSGTAEQEEWEGKKGYKHSPLVNINNTILCQPIT